MDVGVDHFGKFQLIFIDVRKRVVSLLLFENLRQLLLIQEVVFGPIQYVVYLLSMQKFALIVLNRLILIGSSINVRLCPMLARLIKCPGIL